ncbi:MAG: hypothetical protein HC927_07160 [Deltaproteobacteria bacterium]|nr:hypothetical protein [Deltaproteobacteria bacterium]
MVKIAKRLAFKICKSDESKRQVFGWASSAVLGGDLVVDHQADIILPQDLERAAYDYVSFARVGGELHERPGVSRCIESMVLTPEKAESLGYMTEDVRWWVGFQIEDQDTWARVVSGELQEFSIGGEGIREPHPTIPDAYVLKDLAIREVSLVDRGAGKGVAVEIRKEQKMKDKLQKMDLSPALQALGLSEEQIAAVMALLEPLMPGAQEAEAPAPVESAMGNMDTEKEEEEPKDEMAKALKSRVESLEKQLRASERARKIEKALVFAKSKLAHIPMPEDQLAELVVAIDEGALGSLGKALSEALARTEQVLAGGELFKSFGALGRGTSTTEKRDLVAVADELLAKGVAKSRKDALLKANAIIEREEV